MDIALYISELLKDHIEVNLPGIGTFYRKKISAGYNKEEGIFYPPSEEIMFKASGSAGSELVNYISSVKKISDASARYFVNKFTDNILQSLTSEGKADLSPLGILQRTESGIYMQPAMAAGMQFGLAPLNDPAFIPVKKTVEFTAPEKKGEIMPAAETVAAEPRQKSIWQAILVVVMLLLISGSLVYVFYPEFFNLKTDKPIAVRNAVPSPAVAPAIITDTLTSNTDSSPVADAKQTLQKRKDSLASKAIAATSLDTALKYEVIGASLALRTEAETYLKLMQSRGVKAKIIEDTRKPKYKISLGSYTSYEKASQEKRRIQNSFNKEAWIYTIKDKVKQ